MHLAPLYLLAPALLVLFLLPSSVLAVLNVTFTGNGNVSTPLVSVHSQDFFQAYTVPFTRSGYPAYLPFVHETPDAPCQFETEKPNPDLVASRAAFERYNESIMVAEWPRAMQCGVETISQLFALALRYNDSLPAAGLPSSRTLVVLLANQYDGVLGNPVFEPYIARTVGVDDGPPPDGLDVQLVTSDDFRQLFETEQKMRRPRNVVTYTVQHETGPWNELFNSADYRAFVLIIFAVDATVILISAAQLIMVLFRREFSWDIRNIIFLMGLFGTTLYAATLLMRIQTYTTRVVEMVSSYLNTIAFHVLLYLWSIFVMHIRRHRSIYYLRAFIIFGGLTMTFSTGFSAVMLNVTPTPHLIAMTLVVGYWVPITQMILALMFLAYALKFRQRRHGLQISDQTNSALNRLQWLAGIAFFAYMALAFTNLRPITQLMTTPHALMAIIMLRMSAASTRGIALLSVLGVRVPSRNAGQATTLVDRSNAGVSGVHSHAYSRKGSMWPLKGATDNKPSYTTPMTNTLGTKPPLPIAVAAPMPPDGSASWPVRRNFDVRSDRASSVAMSAVDDDSATVRSQATAYEYFAQETYAEYESDGRV